MAVRFDYGYTFTVVAITPCIRAKARQIKQKFIVLTSEEA